MRRLALAVLAATLILGACQPPADVTNGATWRLVLNEEFDRPLSETVFRSGWLGSTNPVQSGESACHTPDMVKVEGGNLVLSAAAVPCGSRPYRAGMVESHGRFSVAPPYYVEARLNFACAGSEVANWPVFWTNGEHWPNDGEWDIAEALSGNVTSVWHDPHAAPAVARFGKLCGWHTYGGLRTSSRLTAYLDGKSVGSYTLTAPITSPHYVILGLQIGQWGGPLQVPSTFQAAYVRVWKP